MYLHAHVNKQRRYAILYDIVLCSRDKLVCVNSCGEWCFVRRLRRETTHWCIVIVCSV